MANLNTLLAALPAPEQAAFYLRCAYQALADYPLDHLTPRFIQHNAGIVFRLADAHDQPQAMLKIHENAGDGGNDTPAQIEAQLIWLAALAEQSGIIVQFPLANRHGKLVALVRFPDTDQPAACTVQRWITGEHVGQWSAHHAHAIGALLATVHNHSVRWRSPTDEQLGRYGAAEISEAFATVAATVQYGLIDPEQQA